MSALVQSATVTAALGAGLMGGFMFAYFTVMRGLARLPAEGGIAAMQEMNLAVLSSPVFFLFFLGTAALSLALLAYSVFNLGAPGSLFLIVGALIYLGGVIVLTMTLHVPMNEALARLEPQPAESATYWTYYLQRWTQWNHVRSVAGFLSGGAFIMAALRAAA